MKVLISINDNLKDMLSGKLPYNMKKPNEHHKYWRYVLSTGPIVAGNKTGDRS